MGRSKAPVQTREDIVQAATRLFVEQGYEQTSVQSILDTLGLSKGGLYHHFRSKEEILEAVIERRSRYVSAVLRDVLAGASGETACARLQRAMRHIAADDETHGLDIVLSAQLQNPYFIAGGLRNCVRNDAPLLAELMREGMADGSLQTTALILQQSCSCCCSISGSIQCYLSAERWKHAVGSFICKQRCRRLVSLSLMMKRLSC